MPDDLANYPVSVLGGAVESLVGRVLLIILAIYAAVCVGSWDFIPPWSLFVAYPLVCFAAFLDPVTGICTVTLLGLSVLFLYSGRLWLLILIVIVQAIVARVFSGTIFGIDS